MNSTKSTFTKFKLTRQDFVTRSYSKFYEEPINGFVTDTRSQTDGWTWSQNKAFSLLRK